MADNYDKNQALACIPFHNDIASWNIQDTGEVLIHYPLPMRPFFKALLQKFNKQPLQNPTKKLQLDEMGSKVWLKIDGEKNLRSIIREFAEETSLTLQEAELSVTTFLRELGKRGLVGLDQQENSAAD